VRWPSPEPYLLGGSGFVGSGSFGSSSSVGRSARGTQVLLLGGSRGFAGNLGGISSFASTRDGLISRVIGGLGSSVGRSLTSSSFRRQSVVPNLTGGFHIHLGGGGVVSESLGGSSSRRGISSFGGVEVVQSGGSICVGQRGGISSFGGPSEITVVGRSFGGGGASSFFGLISVAKSLTSILDSSFGRSGFGGGGTSVGSIGSADNGSLSSPSSFVSSSSSFGSSSLSILEPL
jgi:hypothetical protein